MWIYFKGKLYENSAAKNIMRNIHHIINKVSIKHCNICQELWLVYYKSNTNVCRMCLRDKLKRSKFGEINKMMDEIKPF